MNSNELFNRANPIYPQDESSSSGRNHNVGQQFIDRILPLMDKIRNRPSPNYHVDVAYSHREDEGVANLMHHDPVHGDVYEVGRVSWDPKDGHVHNLAVHTGHRHMTMKLLQHAWDSARENRLYGPATSSDLNGYSAPIVKKYNPESDEYKIYTGKMDDGGNEDYDCCQRAVSGAQYSVCEDCGGPGHSLLEREYLSSDNQDRWVERARAMPFLVCENEHDLYPFEELKHENYGEIKPADFNPAEHGYQIWNSGKTADKDCPSCGGEGWDLW